MLNFVRALFARDEAAPADDAEPTDAAIAERLPVHVLRDGVVGLLDGHLAFRAEGEPPTIVRLDEVDQLSLFGTAAVTTPCLMELMRRGIPVVWRSASGHYVGQTADLSGRAAAARRAQYAAAEDAGRRMAVARALVAAKIANQRVLLRRTLGADAEPPRALDRLARAAAAAADRPALLGTEGAAAAAFYRALPELIAADRRADFPWRGRDRRPPPDALNALLSYLYAVVVGECAVAALATGLDPACGFHHAERPGRPALALDLAEPFRPAVADRAAVAAVNRGEVRPEHFVVAEDGARLTDAGRRAVLAALERRWAAPAPARDGDAPAGTWREAVAAQARRLAAALRAGAAFAAFEAR